MCGYSLLPPPFRVSRLGRTDDGSICGKSRVEVAPHGRHGIAVLRALRRVLAANGPPGEMTETKLLGLALAIGRPRPLRKAARRGDCDRLSLTADLAGDLHLPL